jgi:putative flavoprotein involved in K+ transport
MAEHRKVIIIGGGQAGLAASYCLKQHGIEHAILDRGRIGDTWRNRWDSFCLVTKNWQCRLPGHSYDGKDPEGFMLRDEIVAYIESYAAKFDPPYHGGTEVKSVRARPEGGYAIETSNGSWTADDVVMAAGTYQQPAIPGWAKDADPSVHQLVPRSYRGKDVLAWADTIGMYEMPVQDHPEGLGIRFRPHPHLSGRGGGRTIDLREFAERGIQLYGHLTGLDGTSASFAPDLAASLDAADEACLKITTMIDGAIEKMGIDAPKDDAKRHSWAPDAPTTSLDLAKAGIGTILWATGFRYDFSWIDLPIFDDRGYPKYERGITEADGFYFVGLHWLHTWGSGLFYSVGDDAQHIADHIATRHA